MMGLGLGKGRLQNEIEDFYFATFDLPSILLRRIGLGQERKKGLRIFVLSSFIAFSLYLVFCVKDYASTAFLFFIATNAIPMIARPATIKISEPIPPVCGIVTFLLLTLLASPFVLSTDVFSASSAGVN